jgi:hypothetical protein
VSRDSATCKFIETNPSVTFPIDETHSDMVKFTRGSQYYRVVISKLSSIVALPPAEKQQTSHKSRSFRSSPLPENGNREIILRDIEEPELGGLGKPRKRSLQCKERRNSNLTALIWIYSRAARF